MYTSRFKKYLFFNLKQIDLYKIYQFEDLANLDSLSDSLLELLPFQKVVT